MIRCGFVGLVGLPNVGKSSFLNFLLGENLSIVSSKPQTTRQAMTGVLTTDHYQLIFFDAPGFVEAKAGLFDFLSQEFAKVIQKSDILVVLLAHDQKASSAFAKSLAVIKASGKNYIVLVTKADLKPTAFAEEQIKVFEEEGVSLFRASIKDKKISQDKELLLALASHMPKEHHPLYDPDLISLDRTRDIVADFIREQCFLQLGQEIPYSMGVIIKSFQKKKGLQHIEANILVEKDNHKAIVIGKGGAQLKKIGQAARKKVEEFLGEKIYLGLHVAHKKNWMKNKSIMREVGYFHEPK